MFAQGDPSEPGAGGASAHVRAARVRAAIALSLFAVGLIAARAIDLGPSALWFAGAAGALVLALLASRWASRLALAACVVAISIGWFGLRVREAPVDSVLRLVDADSPAARLGLPAVFDGVVLESPRVVETRTLNASGPAVFASTLFDLSVREMSGDAGTLPASGVMRVSVSGSLVGVSAGDAVRIRGLFIPVSGPLNPGERDARLWASVEGRVGRLEVESAALVEHTAHQPATLATRLERGSLRALAWLRAGAAGWLQAAIDPEDEPETGSAREAKALLSALLIGREDSALVAINDRFARLGIVHVLSISGFHLVVMTGVVLVLIRLTGDRGLWEPLIAGAFVVLYLLVVPAGAPIIRSGIMVLALLAAELAGRRYDRLTILAWVALGVLLWRPMDLWSAGAQLSFGITAVLIGLGRPFHARLFPPGLRGLVRRRRIGGLVLGALGRGLATLLSTSVLCWAVSVPLVLYHTGVVSPLGAFTSLLLVPLFSVLLWLGFVALLLAGVSAWLAAAAGAVLLTLAAVVNTLAELIDGLPGTALYLPAVSALWTACATGVLVWWFGWASTHSARAWWAAALVACWLLVEIALPLRGIGPRVRIDALAVGDGSAILIRAESDALLWGGSSKQPGLARRAVPRALRALGAWHVPRIVVPGATLADVSGLPDLIRPLAVREVLVCPDLWAMWKGQPTLPQCQALAAAQRQGARIVQLPPASLMSIGPATLEARAGDARGGTLIGVVRSGATVLANLAGSAARDAASLLPMVPPGGVVEVSRAVRSATDAAAFGQAAGADRVWWGISARSMRRAGSTAAPGPVHATGLHGAASAEFEVPTASSAP